MMKNFTKLFALVAVMFGFSLGASAQNTATATGDASANIIAPITLTEETPLAFGDIVASVLGGSVVIESDGTRTPTGVTILTTDEGSLASFTVGGEIGYEYSIVLPDDVTVVLSDGALGTMAVSDFTSHVGGSATAIGTVAATNSTFTVGATLTLGANQASGAYTTTYEVTVA